MSDEMRAALEQLVRQAMASGAAYFAENLSKFDSRILSDCFDDFPAQFVQIRGDLVEDVLAAAGGGGGVMPRRVRGFYLDGRLWVEVLVSPGPVRDVSVAGLRVGMGWRAALMGAAEVIAKAIEKLWMLRVSSTPGPWVVEEIEHQAGVGVFVAAHRGDWDQYARALIDNGMDAAENASLQKGDAELIVALHRTIDAQFVILKDARRTLLYASLPGTVVDVFAESAVHNAVALAATILGES